MKGASNVVLAVALACITNIMASQESSYDDFNQEGYIFSDVQFGDAVLNETILGISDTAMFKETTDILATEFKASDAESSGELKTSNKRKRDADDVTQEHGSGIAWFRTLFVR